MNKSSYQTPELWVLTFEKEDVITASGGISEGTNTQMQHDKGVIDLF